ncbi:hypothetical protein DFH07DRAFT_688225, partial [Mycena maculata]
IRLFSGGAHPSSQIYYLDFYDTSCKEPRNAPEGYELWAVTGTSAVKLKSVEEHFKNEFGPLKPGQEKFVVGQGSSCFLVRPHHPNFMFSIPRCPEP